MCAQANKRHWILDFGHYISSFIMLYCEQQMQSDENKPKMAYSCDAFSRDKKERYQKEMETWMMA